MSSVFHTHVDLRTTARRNLSQVGAELLSGDIIRGNILMMRNASSRIFSAVYMGLTVHYMGF